MKRKISSVEGTRRRGLGPGIGVTLGWKVGLGRDGRVCLGRLRAGRGPSTRRREVGGGRWAGVTTESNLEENAMGVLERLDIVCLD